MNRNMLDIREANLSKWLKRTTVKEVTSEKTLLKIYQRTDQQQPQNFQASSLSDTQYLMT